LSENNRLKIRNEKQRLKQNQKYKTNKRLEEFELKE